MCGKRAVYVIKLHLHALTGVWDEGTYSVYIRLNTTYIYRYTHAHVCDMTSEGIPLASVAFPLLWVGATSWETTAQEPAQPVCICRFVCVSFKVANIKSIRFTELRTPLVAGLRACLTGCRHGRRLWSCVRICVRENIRWTREFSMSIMTYGHAPSTWYDMPGSVWRSDRVYMARRHT